MSECPIENECLSKIPDCEESLCELGEHLADWGIVCDNGHCDLYGESCKGIDSGDIEDLRDCTMNTDGMRLLRAVKEVLGNKSPQALHEWTGVSLSKCIRMFSMLV